ncbi:ATP-binding protein [Serpentinicella sp. ANB-PHB4]|uniref:ATP-binding protein n=1 Tax=Serpentinicella sp. ANB-PHB4 TaxID=3074076 RepID=UPI00285F2BBF|nr:ATP-binding protein [Serpentinicella sp. ANB-PHB4]MDR5659871.1 ATP-binding protein [Serpentinicella sp. ANB-PHB4]
MKKNIQTKVCNVNKTSLFKEIAKNILESKEIIREAISNAIDASATNITIEVSIDQESNQFCLIIRDDGMGMDLEDFESFFSLGESRKDNDNIGEKGLGTKTFFKCEKLIVTSQKNGKRFIGQLDKPWEKLNKNIMLEYSIEEKEPIDGHDGTEVRIIDYKVDHAATKHFDFDTLKDYILWYTAAGSFKTKFTHVKELRKLVKNIQISPIIRLVDKINNREEEFVGEHRFSEPDENPQNDEIRTENKLSLNYCKHFGPFHRHTVIDGKYVSFQIYATVSGHNKRSQIVNLQQGQSHKSRFGVVLCKDFMYIINRKDFLLDDANYNHFHIMINSQNFELTSDRNNITNLDSKEVDWIINTAQEVVREQIYKVAQESYFKLKEEEDKRDKMEKKIIETKERLYEYDKYENLNIQDIPLVKLPRNEWQVIVLFSMLLARKCMDYKVGDYSGASSTDMILEDHNGKKLLAEVEYKLSNLFKHEHPLDTIDIVICWMIDMEINEHKTLNNKKIILKKDSENWYLKYGADRSIKVIELKSMVEDLKGNTIIG